MALSRLGTRSRPVDFIWPGFVDALASLLMVFVFVLMVFVLIQANLAYRVSNQDTSLSHLRTELSTLTKLLNLERRAAADLSVQVIQTDRALTLATDARDLLQIQLAEAAKTLGEQDSVIQNAQRVLAENQTALADTKLTLAERTKQLAILEAGLIKRETELAQANNASFEAKAEIDQLIMAATSLQAEMDALRTLLAAKERDAIRDKIAIANLGRSLNNALASRLQELQRFRSEFFGRVRDLLEARADVQVVGDRFVFQSEVLFAPGQARINPAGKQQLARIAAALADIAEMIPADIPWVLQVDGHTDNVPITSGYSDNWDLSTERALSVVRFFVAEGVPANRLAAAGFGEFQPIDNASTDEARQRNRRIEIKLTNRVRATDVE